MIFKVLTERLLGPQRLYKLSIYESWEAEQELRKSDRKKEVEELADMSLLFLTLDSFNPNLLLPSLQSLVKMEWKDMLNYCKEIKLDVKDLIRVADKKVKTNKARNPEEAFLLVADENMATSIERMEKNWLELKKKRDKMGGLFNRKNWWKKWLYVDKAGWVQNFDIK